MRLVTWPYNQSYLSKKQDNYQEDISSPPFLVGKYYKDTHEQ